MTTRSDFIAVAGFGLAAASTADADAALADRPALYDFAAVDARLARPARHRQVFAVARVADGNVTGFVRHSLDAYEITRAQGPGALHAAVVFYGRGVVLGLDDAAWNRYALAEGVRRRGDVLTSPERNANPFSADLARLATRGCTFLVCDNALADWATFLGTSGVAGESIDEIRARLRASLIPTALLVPAGVAALNDAQEARFTFVQASL